MAIGKGHVSIGIGPALMVGHADPHFDRDGCCQCFCTACSRVTAVVAGLFSDEECTCPDCPCASKAGDAR